ncbi:SCP2 sterol-binding domain-containing protein [Streptomyces sulphureus]|uniref:SCP2 sterol-binding domain-containing protein n=1 Tax=Streptomyces sulphureus TaxID=47758 RepID=UPI0003760DEF|nr:SCP2 sterol-binding domain-containing protein [Streptomyces sulphureus]
MTDTDTKTEQRQRFLSEEYFAAFRTAVDALPENPRANVDVQYTVTGGPEGEVTYCLSIRGGRIERAWLGAAEEPDLRISVDYRDLVELHTGEQHAASAFLKGTMRVDGDKAKLLELMLVLQTAVYQEVMRDLCGRTAF